MRSGKYKIWLAAAFLPAAVAMGIKLTGAQAAPAARGQDRPMAHRFEEVADGVYFVSSTGEINTGSNSAVIVTETGVMIVDSHITPASARVLVEEIKTVTDKPVRYVVDTHYHFDHAHGNQIFGPEVQVIGHEFTRMKLAGDVLSERTYVSFTEGIPAQIEAMRAEIAAETDPERRASRERQLRYQEAHYEALREVRPTPPNVTLADKMTIYAGDREIQLHFFGRAHTGGDIVVYLPAEKIACTGDMMTGGLAFMGDGFVGEWGETLAGLMELDFETVLPGHGRPFQGKERIGQFQDYLTELWAAAGRLKSEGKSAEEAAAAIDLSSNPLARRPGVDIRAVRRIYELMDGAGAN